MIRAVLDGHGEVDPEALEAIWSLARGNPRFTRDLTEFAREREALVKRPHGWCLTGELRSSPVLNDQIGRQVAAVRPEATELLRALAVAGPLPLFVIEQLGALDLIGELEHHGLIGLVEHDDERVVRLSHPLLAKMILDTTSTALLHDTRRRVADVLIAQDPELPTTVLTAARLRLDGGLRDPDLFRRGAMVAITRGETEHALRLSTAALRADDGPDGRLLHARAESAAGQLARVDAALGALATLDRGPAWLSEVTVCHAEHLAFRAGNHDEAIALLEARIPALPATAQVPLRGLLSHLLFCAARFDDAVSVALPLISLEPPPIEELAGLAGSWAVDGRPELVLELWDRAAAGPATAPGLSSEAAIAIANFAFARLLALWQTGRAREGDESVGAARSDRVHAALDGSRQHLEVRAAQQLVRGHLDRAGATYRELAEQVWNDAGSPAAQTSGRAFVEAQRGDAEPALRRLDALDVAVPREFAGSAWWVGRARVWTATAAGRGGDGIELALDLVEQHAAEHFHETTTLHDIVRLGRPDLVVDRLALQASRPDATWWEQICADHARAACDRDADRLFEVACRFEEGGLDLHAAEALAQTLGLLDPAVDQARCVAANVRFTGLLERCGRIRTPAFAEGPSPLTPRELAVARLAASGLTNREIASEFGTSTRTVGNQLQSVYDKLDIHDRAVLRSLFDDAVLPASPQ